MISNIYSNSIGLADDVFSPHVAGAGANMRQHVAVKGPHFRAVRVCVPAASIQRMHFAMKNVTSAKGPLTLRHLATIFTSNDARDRDMSAELNLAGEGEATITFASEPDRARLSPTACKAFLRVCAHWKLTNTEAAALLGVSMSTWDRIKADRWDGGLSQDQLTRVSALVGVYKGLRLLFADDMADRWPRLVNRGPLFQNESPVGAMMAGGIPLMLDVRRYVDALRGGL